MRDRQSRRGSSDRIREASETARSELDDEVLDGCAQFLGHRTGSRQIGSAEQDDELLAPVAGHRVGLPDRRPQECAKGPEGGVAGRMAMGVVERLEVVDVEHDQPDGSALPR